MKRLLVFLLFLPSLVCAQESDLGNWIMYFGNKKLSEKFNWHHEVQYRNYDAIGDLEQLLLRTGIGKNLTEGNNNLLLGYGYILSENYIDAEEKASVEEHRIYQQFINNQRWGRLAVQHRYRLEERWVEDLDMKIRFRYFLAAKIPLNHKDVIDKTYYVALYNELFIADQSPVFDRNRLYGGVGYKLSKSLRVELGYMNQFFEAGDRDQFNIGVFASY